MKKLVSILIALMLTISFVPVTAASTCGITITSVNIAGDTVEVPVVISNNPGIAAAMLEIEFDKDALEPVSVEKGTVFTKGTFTSNVQQDIALSTLKTVKVNWVYSANVKTNGTMFTITFKVKENRSSEIKINCGEYDLITKEYESVEKTITDGYVYNYPFALKATKSSTTVTATVTRSQAYSGNAYVCVVAINDDGNMIFIKRQAVDVTSATKKYTAKLTGLSKPYTVKVFIWDDEMKPLSEVVIIEV